MSDPVIEAVQRRLIELGYSGVGDVDGLMGKKTEGSILNFRNRNGLPLTTVIDDDLLNALAVANKIELPIEQVTATVTEIAPKVQAVQKTWWAKFWALLLAIPTGLITIIGWVVDGLGDAVAKLSPLKTMLDEILSNMPPITMILVISTIVTIVALLIGYQTHGAQKDMVKGYNEGTVHNDTPAEEGNR